MIAALTSLLIALGILILIKKGALPSPGAAGKLVLHYPATGPSPVALIALTARSLILDRRLAVLNAAGEPSPLLERARAVDHEDLRVGDSARKDITGKPGAQQLPLRVKVTSPAYSDMVAALMKRGAADPEVVAEAFLAAVSDGSTPRLATCDLALRERLLPGAAPYRDNAAPEPYDATVEGRSLRVIPIAG